MEVEALEAIVDSHPEHREDLLWLTSQPRLKLEDLLQYVLREALRLSSCDAAACLLLLPDGTVPSPELRGAHLNRGGSRPSGEQVSRWLAAAAQDREQTEAREPSRFDDLARGGPARLGAEARSALLVPLIAERRSIGFLRLESSRPRHFGDGHLQPLRDLAAEAVPAIFRLLLREPISEGAVGMDLIGTSPALRQMERQLLLAARSDRVPVLITGERGSGKELAAWAIHRWSPRRRSPFVPVLMSGLPDNLAADELFGHERHSFTGAEERRPGKFEAASGGTLFLDEVADLNLAVQSALLRIVERNELSRLGRDLPVRVEARVTAATNRDLRKAIREGRFREDLYDRLAVFEITVPPLRERPEDVPLLADYFLKQHCAELHRQADLERRDLCRLCRGSCGVACATPGFFAALAGYDWPGNVRELKHLIYRLVATVRGETLEARHLPETFRSRSTHPSRGVAPVSWSLDEAIRRHLETVLDLTGQNKTRAAQLLGIPYTTLQSKLKKLGKRSEPSPPPQLRG